MRLNQLKRLRVGVSLVFFLVTILLFLDFRNWFAPAASNVVLYLQFVPSLLKFMAGATLGAGGFIVVLIMTSCAGRVYCSSICPLGTLQDVIISLAVKRKRHPAHYRQPHHVLRYTFLFLTVLALLAGSGLLLNFLDPFSTFGRIVANIVRPLGIVMNNSGAMILEKFGVYTLVREQWAAISGLSIGIALAVLVLLLWLAGLHGRLYCNTICPIGTILGLVSRFSLLKLRVDDASCTNCRRCVAVCKAGCIDLDTKTVDMSRCVSCYNCLTVCKTDSIGFVRRGRPATRPKDETTDPLRREFLLNVGVYLLALPGLTEPGPVGESIRKIIQSRPTTVPVVRTSPVSPPGSLSVTRFTRTCTACHLCVSACPPQILLPSFLEYGVAGLMQPRMHFQTGHCNYECTICGEVCPTGAILPLPVAEKKLIQTGVAKFIKENCVVFTDNTACGACSEHCPTKAVNMVPYKNPQANQQTIPGGKSLTIPELKPELCVGCGGCEHACPTKPYKAIFVDGNPVHKRAQKPVVQEVDQKVDYKEDFPF